MKINKDKKMFLSETNRYKLELIADYYGIKNPEVTDLDSINIGNYHLDVELKNRDLDIITYRIMLSNDSELPIIVKLSNQDYTDLFKIAMCGFAIHIKRIFKKDDVKLEKNYYKPNDNYLKSEKELNKEKVIFNTYNYDFKNDNLNSNIQISFPANYPFVENLFVKSLMEKLNDIEDIETLYSVVKHVLGCKDVSIGIINNKEEIEKICTDLGELIDYRRIKGNKLYEYKKGYENVMVTEHSNISLEDPVFQKVLKDIRS